MTGAQTSTFAGAGGRLGLTTWEGEGQTVIGLHGFTLRGGMFDDVVDGRSFVAPDLPGHGRSRIEDVSMTGTVGALVSLIETMDDPGVIVGYSMGGRIGLHLALERPDLVPGLVVISSGLGIADSEERRTRRSADEVLASEIIEVGVERFIDRWIEQPITGTGRLPEDVRDADRTLRLVHDAAPLAAALIGLGPGNHDPLHERLIELTMPVTWMAGGDDPKYAALAHDASARTGGRAVIVDKAGHNLVLERPEAVTGTIRESVAMFEGR